MKRGPIINIVVGLIWIGLGILAMTSKTSLALFGVVPIPNILVVIIGVVWAVLGIVALLRAHPAPVAPAPVAQPYPVTPQPQQYDPSIPQYAPREPQGPTPI